jgi:hypothetical protein
VSTVVITAKAGSTNTATAELTITPTLYKYMYTLYAYDSDGKLLDSVDVAFQAQDDNQATVFLANIEAGWGQQLDDNPTTSNWVAIHPILDAKDALN